MKIHYNRPICCRRCEENGLQANRNSLAAPRCPFNNCLCETCADAMSIRAHSIIRRHRRSKTRNYRLVLKPVHLRNGNTRFRVFPEYTVGTERVARPAINCEESEKDSANEHTAQNEAKEEGHEQHDMGDHEDALSSRQSPCIAAPTVAPSASQLDDPHPIRNITDACALANAALSSLLATPSSHLISQLETIHQSTVALTSDPPNSHAAQAQSTPNASSSPNLLYIDCSIADYDQNVPDETKSVFSGRLLTVPIIFAEKFSRNLYLSPTADHSHPMFNHFLNIVQMLEETINPILSNFP